MKCPQCGDDIVNGACRFCGYRPTAADREAMERWAAQKKALENGSMPEPARREWPAKPAKPARQPAARSAAKPPGRNDGRTAAQPKAQPERRARKPARPKARDGPGFFGRMLPRIVVFLWAALLVYLIVTELAAGAMP